MFAKVKSRIPSGEVSLQLAAVAFVYMWSNLSHSTYTFFMLGVISTLVTEAVVFWKFLTGKILKESGKKINLDLAKIELKRILGYEVGVNLHDVERKIKKKKYYQNNKSKPLLLASEKKHKKEIDSFSALDGQDSNPRSRSQTFNPQTDAPTFSHKPINELLKMKERSAEKSRLTKDPSPSKSNFEERTSFIKVGHKSFNEKLSEYLKILECISSSEKTYGKDLHVVTTDIDLRFSILEKSYLDKEEKKPSVCGMDAMNEEELAFLRKKFGKYIQYKQAMVLPQWKSLKDTVSLVGKIHFNCSYFVSQVSVATIDMMSVEYNEKYAEIKSEKKRIAKDYEEAYIAYFKLKNEYETLNKSLHLALEDYQKKYKKKETDEIVLKHEMKARLLKSQLDSLRNKLVSATDHLKEMSKTVHNENAKLQNFIHEWNLRKGAVCQNVLRSVVSMLEENAVDCERKFEKLIGNLDELYRSFHNIDDVAEVRDNGHLEEQNDAITRLSPKINLFERSPSVRVVTEDDFLSRNLELQMSGNEKVLRNSAPVDPRTVIPEVDAARRLKEFKALLDKYNKTYAEEIENYTQELKRSKEVSLLLIYLAKALENYIQEKTNLVTFTTYNLDLPSLDVYWTIVQENLKLVTTFSVQLREKLILIEKVHAKNIRFFEKGYKNSSIIVNNADKRASNFVRCLERELAANSISQVIRQWFKKPESTDSAPNSGFLGFENKILNQDDDPIGAETEYLKNDFKIGLTQIKHAISSFQKESSVLKKDIIMAYLQCYSSQKELLFALIKEIDKISHFTENLETQLEEIKNDNDDEDVEIPDPPYARFESMLTPIKINKVPEFEIPDQKEQSFHSDTDSIKSLKEVNHGPPELIWINKMLKVFGLEWSKSAYFKEKMMKSLYTAFNKKKAKLIKQIKVLNFVLGDKVPEVRNITNLPSDKFEFLADFELGFQGLLSFEVEVQFESQPILNMLNQDKPMFIHVKILLKSLTGKIRICWVPSDYGTSWFSFVGEPILDLQIEPKVGQTQFDLSTIPHVTNFLKEFMEQRVRKMVYPYRKELDLPMAFRSFKVVPPKEEEELEEARTS